MYNNNAMAGEVFKFVGEVSCRVYGGSCLPNANDYETAFALNLMYDVVKQSVKWADTERLLVQIAYPEVVEHSVIKD